MSIAEVSLGQQAFRLDQHQVMQDRCFLDILDGSDIISLFVTLDEDLPAPVGVLTDSNELAPALVGLIWAQFRLLEALKEDNELENVGSIVEAMDKERSERLRVKRVSLGDGPSLGHDAHAVRPVSRSKTLGDVLMSPC